MAEIRSWRNPDRVMLKDVLPLDTPFDLQIEPSSMCNARCIYCHQSANPTGELMPMTVFRKILSDAKGFPSKIKLVDLYSSGEPLCNPHFADMVAEVKAEGIAERVGVTTNGLLLTPKRIDEIISAGLDVMRISLNGLDAESYHRTCGVRVAFDKFVETLEYLYANRKQCSIHMKIADIALKGFQDGERLFEEKFGGMADTIFVEHILPIYDNIAYESMDENIQQNAITGRYGMEQKEMHKVCYRPFIKLQVSVNGDITASCCSHPIKDVIFGNVADENLVDVWNSEIRRAFLKMHLKGKRFQHPFCKDCVVPNDVAHTTDLLDPYAEEILERF